MPRRAENTHRSVELERSKTPLMLAAIVLVGIAATAGAIMWGTSDRGQINVSATIANSQSTGAEGETGIIVATPTEEQRNLPNGGLVPQNGTSVPAPASAPVIEEQEMGTTTGSTTSEAAQDQTGGGNDTPPTE